MNTYKTIIHIISLALCVSCTNQVETKKSSEKEKAKTPSASKLKKQDSIRDYGSIIIGGQVWMQGNLDVDHFRNGDKIPRAETDEEWEDAGKAGNPAWCYYANERENGKKYGKLYNWHAVNDPRGLAPDGWSIPNREDWEKFKIEAGGLNTPKEIKRVMSENWNGTNESGFNAFPAGGRFKSGEFKSIGEETYFWSSTDASNRVEGHNNAFLFLMHSKWPMLSYYPKEYGLSVRCIKQLE